MVNQEQEKKVTQIRVFTICFHAGWVLLVILALRQRFALPGEPFVDPDVWGFLSPPLSKLLGGAFAQTNGRPYVYPAFLYVILAVFRDLKTITVCQHLLGIGTGLLLLANWMTARRLLPKPVVPHAVHQAFGLVMLAIFLLSTQPITDEHHIRPEAISPFFAAFGFLLTTRFLLAKYRERNPKQVRFFGFTSLFVAFLLPMFKPSYLLTAFLTTVPVWVHLFDRRETLRRRLLCTVGPVIAAALLLWYPNSRYAAASPDGSGSWDESIFIIHALQIREQMAQDVAERPAGLAYPMKTIPAALQLLDSELEISRGGKERAVAALGFDPDYLLYGESFHSKLPAILPTAPERAAFCRYYFLRTWRARPDSMLRKVGKQLALFSGWHCPVYHSRNLPVGQRYASSVQALEMQGFLENYRRYRAHFPPLLDYSEAIKKLGNSAAPFKQRTIFKNATEALADSYLVELILFAAIVIWLMFNVQERARLGLISTAIGVGYGYNFGNTLGIALLHSLWVGRYSHVQFATTLLTQALFFCLFIEVAAGKFIARISRATSAGPGSNAVVVN